MRKPEGALEGAIFLQSIAGVGNTRESWDAMYETLRQHPFVALAAPEMAAHPMEMFKQQLARDKRKENGNLVKYYEKRLQHAVNDPDAITMTDSLTSVANRGEGQGVKRDLAAEAFAALSKLAAETPDPALLPQELEFVTAVRQAHLNNLEQRRYQTRLNAPRKSFADIVTREFHNIRR